MQCTMSETMKELLRGVGVADTRLRLYGVGHWGVVMRKILISYPKVGSDCLAALMCGMHGPDVLYEGTVHRPPGKIDADRSWAVRSLIWE